MQVHGFGGELQQKPERSSRSSRSTFGTPSLGGSLGPSRQGQQALQGQVWLCLAGLPDRQGRALQGNQAEGGLGTIVGRRGPPSDLCPIF